MMMTKKKNSVKQNPYKENKQNQQVNFQKY